MFIVEQFVKLGHQPRKIISKNINGIVQATILASIIAKQNALGIHGLKRITFVWGDTLWGEHKKKAPVEEQLATIKNNLLWCPPRLVCVL